MLALHQGKKAVDFQGFYTTGVDIRENIATFLKVVHIDI